MNPSEAKKALRKATIGGSKSMAPKIVKYGEMEIELRAPKLSEQSKALKALGLTIEGLQNLPMADLTKLHIESLIACAYVPGTDEKLFEETDKQEMLDHPVGSFVGELGKDAFGVFIGGTHSPDAVGKGSAKTEAGASASS
jgi:hypothetical protein